MVEGDKEKPDNDKNVKLNWADEQMKANYLRIMGKPMPEEIKTENKITKCDICEKETKDLLDYYAKICESCRNDFITNSATPLDLNDLKYISDLRFEGLPLPRELEDRLIRNKLKEYDNLVGKYFHIKECGLIQYQGYIKKKINDTYYLVETFSFFDGSVYESHLESISNIYNQKWTLFDTAEDMREARDDESRQYTPEQKQRIWNRGKKQKEYEDEDEDEYFTEPTNWLERTMYNLLAGYYDAGYSDDDTIAFMHMDTGWNELTSDQKNNLIGLAKKNVFNGKYQREQNKNKKQKIYKEPTEPWREEQVKDYKQKQTQELLTAKGIINFIKPRDGFYTIKIDKEWYTDFDNPICELSEGQFVELKYINVPKGDKIFHNIKEICVIEEGVSK